MKIHYDVDTQNDFMNPSGALYVPDAESIKPNLKKLTDHAKKNKELAEALGKWGRLRPK